VNGNGDRLDGKRTGSSLERAPVEDGVGIIGIVITATRDVAGASSFKVSNILPMTESSKKEKPVTLPPGRARLVT
jgi:hypothetical protein